MELDLTLRGGIEAWHDFYLLSGTAAVTLMGLLFVALSIHLERVVGESGAHLEAMAREAFSSFLIVLFVSLLMLAPELARRPLGVSMLAVGILRLLQTLSRMRQVVGPAAAQGWLGPRALTLRFVLPLAGSGLLAIAGILFLARNSRDALVLVMTACVLLLGDATRTAYELLVRTARTQARTPR